MNIEGYLLIYRLLEREKNLSTGSRRTVLEEDLNVIQAKLKEEGVLPIAFFKKINKSY